MNDLFRHFSYYLSLWLRPLHEVSRYRAHAPRGLAFAAAHVYFLPLLCRRRSSHFMIFVIVGDLSLSLRRTLRTKLGSADESGFLLRCAFVIFLLHLPRELFRRRLLLV